MKSSLKRIFPRKTTFLHSHRSQQFTVNQKFPVYYQPGLRHFKMIEGTWWLTSLLPVKAASPRKTIQSALQWFGAQENLWVFWGASVVRHCNCVCCGLARDPGFHVVIIQISIHCMLSWFSKPKHYLFTIHLVPCCLSAITHLELRGLAPQWLSAHFQRTCIQFPTPTGGFQPSVTPVAGRAIFSSGVRGHTCTQCV